MDHLTDPLTVAAAAAVAAAVRCLRGRGRLKWVIGVKEELLKSCFGHCTDCNDCSGRTLDPLRRCTTRGSWLLLVLPFAWRTDIGKRMQRIANQRSLL